MSFTHTAYQRHHRLLIPVWLLTAVAIYAASQAQARAAAAAPHYDIAPLAQGPFGFSALEPADISDTGQIVGVTISNDASDFRGFSLVGGQVTLLDPLDGGSYSWAVAVNNLGEVVGRSDLAGIPKAAFWGSSTASPDQLPTSGGGGANAYATDINDSTEITGFYTSSGSGNVNSWEAIRWSVDDRGRFVNVDLNQPAVPPPGTFTAAYGVNSSGESVGTGASTSASVLQAALRWSSGNTVQLLVADQPIQFARYQAEAINDSRIAAGWVVDASGNSTPLKWNADGTAVALGLPPSASSAQAIDVNNDGTILVNASDSPLGPMTRAYVSVDGEWWNLQQQLTNAAGWEINSASAINNSGQIVGMGILDGVPTGFVLTQSTAPAPSGDFDQDGDVDGHDFLMWQRGASPNPLSVGDLANWQANFGTGSLMATNVAAPEPSTWMLLALAVMGSEFTRRRRITQ